MAKKSSAIITDLMSGTTVDVTAWTTTSAIVVATTTATLYIGWTLMNGKKKKCPPKSDVGIFSTIRAMAFGGFRDYLIGQFETHGRIVQMNLMLPGVPMVVMIADVNDARQIFKDGTTTKPSIIYDAMSKFSCGPNIVSICSHSSSGDRNWYHRRKGMNPAFAPKRIRIMNEKALTVAQRWEARVLKPIVNMSKGQSFNVGDEMIDITIAIICLVAFDYDCSPEERQQLVNDMTCAWPEFTMKEAFYPFRSWCTKWIPERQQALQATSQLQQFAVRMLHNYRTNPSPTSQTVIEMIVKNTNYANDDERISDIIMVLFAGHDTTGYTLALAFRELAKHPNVQCRLREELTTNSKVNNKDKSTDQNEREGSAAVPPKQQQTSYLKAVVSETMRMYPVLSTPGVKILGRDYVTNQDKFHIPKGSVAFISQIGIARDPTIFENPYSFMPERWLDTHSTPATNEMKQAMFPFAIGNRNCIGQPLANAELYTFLSYFVERYEFTIQDEGKLLSPATLRLDDCLLRVTKVAP